MKAGKPKRLKTPKQIKVEDLYPPQFAGLTPPESLFRNRKIGTHEVKDKWNNITIGTQHLAGVGSEKAQILFITPCTLWEEEYVGRSGIPPQMLKGPHAALFKRNLGRAGILPEDWFYTALVKYNCLGLKPKAHDLRWGRPALLTELKAIRPKIIVCLGKQVFDQFTHLKVKLADVQGGFFRNEEFDCLVYPMDTIGTPLQRPEHLERFIVDLKQVKRALDESKGIATVKLATDYHVLDTVEKIGNWSEERRQDLEAGRLTNMAVDCEWHGQTFAGGQLRSLQASWGPGKAAYLRFMGEELDYSLAQPLPEVAKIIQPCFNHPRLKFVGHNFFADALWMKNHLGIETYKRCLFDTLFAQHTLDESSDLKLERLAVRYTDLGRYDIPLLLWKKKTKFDEEWDTGYGRVPDKILIPYANMDCDATNRIYPLLMGKLMRQQLWGYYQGIVIPFVTDGFTEMVETGFPMNRDRLEEMRTIFTRNQGLLITDFRQVVDQEAHRLLGDKLESGSGDLMITLQELRDQHYQSGAEAGDETQEFTEALTLVKTTWDNEQLKPGLPFFLHWWAAPTFNINSTDHLRRWLFDVKGFTPLKTTKKDGIQTSWERVKVLPPDKQAEYTPATDKQTVKLFAERDPVVARVQELKGVANIVKAFLKGPDAEGHEQGLMAWIQPDERIHPNYALTETARPRSWNPNVLNWTKYVTKPIEVAFRRANKKAARDLWFNIQHQTSSIQEKRLQIQNIMQAPVSVRSFVQAPDGWVFVDMDFKTAEVVQLGYTAGDESLIGVLNEPDTQFARVDKDNPKKVVRVAYDRLSGYPESEQDPALLVPESDPRIMRDAQGNIMRIKRDLHWELAEGVEGKPREKLNEDAARGGIGKVGNFCIAKGEHVLTDRGWVEIEHITLSDKLWDGIEWVAHAGVVCNGDQTVHQHQGLWATDNHEVWTETQGKLAFGLARKYGLRLLQVNDHPARFSTEGSPRTTRVYDILNVGPRHRYVCNGVLVSNSIPYGSTDLLLERMIESNTGRKPAEGTGAKMIETYAARYATAWRFLEAMERRVEDPGWYRSTSGRVRHFAYSSIVDVAGLTEYARKGLLSPLKRQARNFPIQEGVAATAARAMEQFLARRRELGLEARMMCLLYDAMTVLSPLEQAREASALLQHCMTKGTPWTNHGRTWNHDVDVGYAFRWGCKLNKAEKAKLEGYV